MRTTVTLDPDVEAKLRSVARERRQSFKATLNEAVRAGLSHGRGSTRRYRVPARSMRVRRGVTLDHALRLASELEDAEIVRKMQLRK